MSDERLTTFDVIVSKKERFAYASGDSFAGAGGLITAIYVVFMVLNGISPGMAGTIVMLSKIWDAVTDPWMGVISDNARTKWGRRRPFIFFGGLFVVFSFGIMFLPLYALQSVWFKYFIYLLGYLFYSTVSTVINVPYSALSTEITSNYNERNKINGLRLIFSMISSAISAAVPILLIERLQKGELKVSTFSIIIIFVFGIFYTIPVIITALFTKERVPLPEEKNVFSWKAFFKPLKLKPFLYLVVMYFAAFACMDLITTNIVFLANYALNIKSSIFLLGTIIVSYSAMIPFHNKMMKKKSKALLYRMGIPLFLAGLIAVCLYPSNISEYYIYPLAATTGIGISGCILLPWYIFPDIVDLGELKFDERNTGSYSGIMTFIRKSTSAVAIGVSGFILELAGFRAPVTNYETGYVEEFEQTAGAIWGLRLVILIPAFILIGIAFFASIKLKITPERSKLAAKILTLKKEDKLHELTPEENKEFETIKKELLY